MINLWLVDLSVKVSLHENPQNQQKEEPFYFYWKLYGDTNNLIYVVAIGYRSGYRMPFTEL